MTVVYYSQSWPPGEADVLTIHNIGSTLKITRERSYLAEATSMKRMNLMFNPNNMNTPLWKKLLQWLPYAAIIAATALAMHSWSQHNAIKRLEKRLETVQSSDMKLQLEAIKKLVGEMAAVEGKVTEGKEESKVIKVDIGKTIKEFNRDVKATKEISTADDSVAALHNAWSK